jgi:hypothetical protein
MKTPRTKTRELEEVRLESARVVRRLLLPDDEDVLVLEYAARFWRRRLEEQIHLAFAFLKLMSRLGGVQLVWRTAQGAVFQGTKPVPDKSFSGNRRKSLPPVSIMLCHHTLQYFLRSFVPALGVEKLVAESPHAAEGTVLDLKEELPFDNVARFAIGKWTRARPNGRSLEGRSDTGLGRREGAEAVDNVENSFPDIKVGGFGDDVADKVTEMFELY